jgi:hypothetical protein
VTGIRRINLTVNGYNEYEVIKEVVDHDGNKNSAALKLGCTRRTIDRHIAGYKAEGKVYFIHGNSGRKPAHTMSEAEKQDILDLYRNKYFESNFAHFAELLEVEEKIFVSESVVRNIMAAADILSPRATRRVRRELKKKLEAELKRAKTKKEAEEIRVHMVEMEDAHARRPRCANFGEMIQMDASLHLWFGDKKATLHTAIDDATGAVVGAWFEEQETLRGYYSVFRQILTKYGIPYMFYTDRRTVFEYKKLNTTDATKDTMTQFSYACKQFGVQIETTSIAQAKGRVERLIQTMQSRLPVEFRLKGVTTIEQANEILPGIIERYNARFALLSNSIPSVFEKQPSEEKIDLTLAVISERTVDNGHSLRYDNKYFRTLNGNGIIDYLKPKTKGLVIHSYSGGLFYSVDNLIFALEEIPEHERTSKNFDYEPPKELPKKKPYVPAPNHPWRLAAFSAFIKKQNHLASAVA